jgi:rod shape-determining protein MreD
MRAFLTGAERIEIIARMSAAYGLMLCLFMLDIVAAPHPLTMLFSAPFTLMALYYWAIYRPTLVPSWLAFLVGFSLDVLGGFPLGVNALLYLVMRMFLVGQRRFLMGQGFLVTWIGFVFLSAALHVVQWVMMSTINVQMLPFNHIILPVLLGSLVFPVISAFLHLSHKILLSDANK